MSKQESKISFGKSLIKEAQEALAIAKGVLKPVAVYGPETVLVMV